MHRFFVPEDAIHQDTVVFPPELAHQIRSVLRMAPGQPVIVLDNAGWEYELRLTRVERGGAEGQILARRPAPVEPAVPVTLYQSLIKRDRFEWLLQKGTEVGVSRFVPMISRHTVLPKADRVTPNREARWQRIITEAAEQCRRGRLPQLASPITMNEAVDQLPQGQLALIPWEGAAGTGIRAALQAAGRPDHIALFIGPEGGFAQDEVAYARQRGVHPVTLGPRILRAETAAVVAAALILYELGEMA